MLQLSVLQRLLWAGSQSKPALALRTACAVAAVFGAIRGVRVCMCMFVCADALVASGLRYYLMTLID
jgi:hypothetical protein